MSLTSVGSLDVGKHLYSSGLQRWQSRYCAFFASLLVVRVRVRVVAGHRRVARGETDSLVGLLGHESCVQGGASTRRSRPSEKCEARVGTADDETKGGDRLECTKNAWSLYGRVSCPRLRFLCKNYFYKLKD